MFSFPRVFVLLAIFGANCNAQIAEPQQTVGRIHGYKAAMWEVRTENGTGWCLDQRCTTVVTAYHVAKPIESRISFNGVKIHQALLATGPDDVGARVLPSRLSSQMNLKLTWVRDFSLLRPEKPLPQMHGVPLYLGQLRPNETMTVYGYPEGHFTSVRAVFVREVENGILEFDLQRTEGVSALEGLSGALVVNEVGQAVGLLFGMSPDWQHGYVVPMWSLADFIRSARPDLYQELFPREVYRPTANPIVIVSNQLPGDFHPVSVQKNTVDPVSPEPVVNENYLLRGLEKPQPAAVLRSLVLRQRAAESFEVRELRRKAHLMSDHMKNFLARETLALSDRTVLTHDLRVVDGEQVFRDARSGRELSELPIPSSGAPVPGDSWATLPEIVATKYSLPIQFTGDDILDGHPIKIFRYEAGDEDQACRLRIAHGIFSKVWRSTAPCWGEVWTDQQFNILRITQETWPPAKYGIQKFQEVILYAWLQPDGSTEKWLVPARTLVRVQTRRGYTYDSVAAFSNYHLFAAATKINF